MTINMLQTKRAVLVLVLISLFCTTALFAGAKVPKIEGENPFVVKNLQVLDIPNDDGSGLQITWEPLPNEFRIISYRVYRGVSKDSLFYIGEIPVNPKMGVSSPTMSFLDKDYNRFIDISSPGRLRHEKGQSKDSPIFRSMPRDLSVLGPQLKHYNLLGVIPKKEFYYRTSKVEQDGTVYAGLKTHQFPIFKKLIPGNTYYYTVIAVNERRQFLPHAEPVAGVPIDNEPEIPNYLYPVFVEDTNKLNFEWDQPVYKDDIRFFAIYAVADEEAYLKWYETKDTKIPADLIYRISLPQPFNPPTFAQLNIQGNNVIDENGEILYTFTKGINNYKFVLSYIDYSNLSSYSKLFPVRTVNSSMIPQIPDVVIKDRINDKGDYLTFYWGRPFARITAVNYLNEARTRVQMSYDFSTNEDNKIKNIYFEISDENGNVITTVNEYFQDYVFNFSLTNIANPNKLKVRMYFRTENGLDENYYVTQELIFDESINTLRPQKLYFDSFCVDDFNFQLLKRTKSTQLYRVSKKFPAFDRETVDLIAYEASVFKGVSNYDLERNLLLVDPNIDLVFDKETKSTIQTPIYASEAGKVIDNLNSLVAEYQEKVDNAVSEDEKANYQMYVDHYANQLRNQKIIFENNEHLQYVNSITSNRARARAIAKLREVDRREFTYQLLISDGKGLLYLADLSTDENGNVIYHFPVPNWFNTEKTITLIASLLFALLVTIFIQLAKRGKDLYIRPIAGIEEIDNAIGRATEMGRPILFCPGLSGINDVATLAGLSILSRVAKKAAEYDTRILVPCRDYIVMPIAQEIVREAHYEAGRPDSFDKNNVFFMSEQQFAYVAGVNGVMIREKTATNFYMGMFFAESLIMTETGNATGAIQIAGTDAVTQIPFFITTCDYTLIGEELYAASAYMARQPLMLGTLKAQDYAKFLILIFLVLGTLLGTMHVTAIIDAFPSK